MRAWEFFDCDVMMGNTLVPQPSPLLTVPDLLQEMDRFGIGKALVYYHHRFKDRMNRLTLDAVKLSPRLAPCWVLPMAPVLLRERLEEHVEEMLRAGARAARFVPDEGPTAGPMLLRRFMIDGILERLDRHRVPLLIAADHFSSSAANTYGFDQIHEICTGYPNIPVILLQVKFPTQAPLIALMRRHANLHFTISWFGLFRQVESMTEMFGPERLLFGSGLPVGDPAMGVGMVSYGKLTPEQKRLIAGGNLSRLIESVQ